MRTTHRIPTLYWIVLGASVLAAIYAWVVFITTLNFHVYPTEKFMYSLVGSTAMPLFWATYILIRTTRKPPNRQATNELCAHAIRVHRAMKIRRDLAGTPGNDPEDTALSLHAMAGKLTGLRTAICILNGWEADTDADKEGPADQLIQAYWEKTHPADWATRA
jgi:hypothetical protein